MKLPIGRLLTFILLQSLTTTLQASETGYEVELIIFEDVKARYLNSEDWSYNDMLNNKKDELAKTTKTEPDPEFKQLSWDDSKLSNQIKTLKNNSNYRILETKRWKQTGLDKEHAFNISIDIKASNTEVETPKNTAKLITPDAPVTLEPSIAGSVKLIMSRYLHFNINLQYTRPQSSEDGEIVNMVIPIVNERRMRSREIHYIDHPLVGVIVLATPYKIITNEDNATSTEYKTM